MVARLRGGIGFLLKKRGVQVLTGTAVLAGSKAVEVTAEGGEVTRLEARNIVIAIGSEPVTPRVFGYDGDYVLTSEDVLQPQGAAEADTDHRRRRHRLRVRQHLPGLRLRGVGG